VFEKVNVRKFLPLPVAFTPHEFISPASIIVSDQWRAYRDIPNLPGNYTHYTVNHSENFVDPVTGKHTNHVESYWMRMKSTFKRMNGTYKDFGPSYMDEFMWREP